MTVFGRVTAHLVPEIVAHIPGENCSEKINFLKENIIIEGIQGEKESWNQYLSQSHQLTIGVTATLEIVNVLDTAIAEMTSALLAMKGDTGGVMIDSSEVYQEAETPDDVPDVPESQASTDHGGTVQLTPEGPASSELPEPVKGTVLGETSSGNKESGVKTDIVDSTQQNDDDERKEAPETDKTAETEVSLPQNPEQAELFETLALIPVNERPEKAGNINTTESSDEEPMEEAAEEGEVMYKIKQTPPQKSVHDGLMSPSRRSARIKARMDRKQLKRKKKKIENIVVIEMPSNLDQDENLPGKGITKNVPENYNTIIEEKSVPLKKAVTGHIRRVNKDEMVFEDDTYTCQVCFYSSMKERSVREHILNQHRPKQYDCNLCEKNFITRGALNKHLVTHGNFCKLCKQNFDSEELLEEHTPTCEPGKNREGLDGSGEEQFTCSLCAKSLSSRGKLNRHVREVHYGMNKKKKKNNTSTKQDGEKSPAKRYNCSVCSMGFTDASNRNRHMRETHRNLRNKPGDKNRVHQCNICGHLCNSEGQLKSHTRMKHDLQKPDGTAIDLAEVMMLKCVQCTYSSSSIRCINEHIDRKHGTETLKCPECPKQFNSKRALYCHRRVHEEGAPKSDVVETHVLCKYCGMAYMNTEQLRTHMVHDHLEGEKVNNSEDKEVKKEMTDEERAVVSAIKLSAIIIKEVRLKSVGNIDTHAIIHVGSTIQCMWCLFIGNSRTSLNQHVKNNHTVEGRLQMQRERPSHLGPDKVTRHTMTKEKVYCSICGISSASKGLLRRHMKDIHREVVMKENDRDPKRPIALLCMLCSKAYGRRNLIISHLGHAHPQIFSDNITSSDIDGYIVEHFSTPFSCLKCNFMGKNERSLNEHVQRSHTDKIFMCEECGKGFGVKKDLVSHGKVHSRADWPTCEHCGVQKASDHTLKNHILREHLGIKVPYKYEPRKTVCPICGQNVYRTLYEGHLNAHSGHQPYKCNLCNKSFFCKMKMNRHMKIHAGTEFPCHFCSKVFPTREQWKRHIKRHAKSRATKIKVENSQAQLATVVTEAELATQEVEQSAHNLVVRIKEEHQGEGLGEHVLVDADGMTLPENVVICTAYDPNTQEIVIQSLDTL